MNAGRVVARNIRRLRVRQGLSQEGLAAEASIDRTYVSQLERELKNPTVSILEKVAAALGCDIRDLFDVDSVVRPSKPLPSGRWPKNGNPRRGSKFKQG
jgi:transcriptional regulator with XRE-family HTH domain